jgi:hypothetical protein
MPRAALFLVLLSTVASLPAQTPRPSLPDPVRFVMKYDITWNVVRAVMTEMGLAIELEDKKGGRITTKPYEFITGSLTSSEVDKVAMKQNTISGAWLKGRYSAEGLLEIVSPTTTLVTVRTRIEALNRDLDGTQKWVPLESLGVFEKRILGRVSMKIMGNEMQFDKKGFWDKSPQPVIRGNPKPFPGPPER